MDGTLDDMGVLKGLKDDVKLISHQDLTQVGGDDVGELFAETKPISLVENHHSACEVNVEDQVDYDKLREQIKYAQFLIDEKTIERDNIQSNIEMKTTKLQSIYIKFEATQSDEIVARRSIKLKRQEIDSVQDGITRVKNLISVIDITNRIMHMEHMVEHETIPLKEGKQLLCEINILKKLRDQISSNVYPTYEVALDFSQIESLETQLKTLKRQLGDLKMKVSNNKADVILLGNEYNEECQKLEKLQAQFRTTNNVRQDTYKEFLSLKRQLCEKSKLFWMYKDEAETSNGYALRSDVEIEVEDKEQTQKELELARKAEMLKKKEIDVNLKEKIRQKERAKAHEALERKKRNAEKAQMRAMFRAQKEAEEKDKERKKKKKKKEKKNVDGEIGPELQTEFTKDKRIDSSGTQLKKSSQTNKYIKSKPTAIPPTLRNRGKRHCKEFLVWILIIMILPFIFMVVTNDNNHKTKPIIIKDNKFSDNRGQPI